VTPPPLCKRLEDAVAVLADLGTDYQFLGSIKRTFVVTARTLLEIQQENIARTSYLKTTGFVPISMFFPHGTVDLVAAPEGWRPSATSGPLRDHVGVLSFDDKPAYIVDLRLETADYFVMKATEGNLLDVLGTSSRVVLELPDRRNAPWNF
jgi:hypothetical protein